MKSFTFFFLSLFICVNSFSQEKQEFKFVNGKTAYWVKGNDGWGVEDDLGKILVPKIYGKLSCYGNMIYCKEKKNGGKFSCELYNYLGERKISEEDGYTILDFVKSKGKWIASCSFGVGRPASVFDENGNMIYKYKMLTDAEGFNYLINELADTIVIEPGKYTGTLGFTISGDVINTYIGNKKGIVNLDGTMVIPAMMFCDITPSVLSHEIKGFWVGISSKGGPKGYYDRLGNCIIPANKYTAVYSLANGLFEVIENGKAMIIDSLGNVKFKTKYTGLELQKDEQGKWFYVTYLGNGRGKINEDGSLIEEAKPTINKRELGKEFKYIEILNTNGLYGATSVSGNSLLPCEYEGIYYDDFYASKIRGFEIFKNGTMGFADNDGNIIIPCGKYNKISSLQGDGEYFIVEYMGRKGLCDKNGNELIKPIYDDLNIRHGLIFAKVGIMEGVLDKKGNVVVPFEYTEVNLDRNTGNFRVKLFKKEGLCDNNGKLLIPPRYTNIIRSSIGNGPLGEVYRVKDGKFEGLYKNDGTMLFPATLFENVSISNIKYGLPFENEWFIRAYNNSKEFVCYYDFNGNLLYDNRQEKLFDKYFEQGGDEFDRGNYKRAIDYYNQALGVKQDGSTYYNIGAAYYNLGNYKDAIRNLNSCVNISKSQRIADKAYDLKIECEQCLQQKRERRANLWMGILGSALNVATTVVQTNNAIHNYNSNTKTSSTGGFKRDTSLDYLLDPRYTIMQVQQQNWNEYLQTTNGGQTMTYEEWCALKAQAWAESQKAESGSYTSASSSSSSSSTSAKSSSGRDCRLCLGTGKCNTCNGKGWFTALGIGSGDHPCPNCQSNHNGRCSSCGGTGKR